jgi:hypothetical protein
MVCGKKRFDDITIIEQQLERFSNVWASIALNWANLSLTERQFQKRLEQFRTQLSNLRNDFRKQYEESGLTLRELIDFLGGPAQKEADEEQK